MSNEKIDLSKNMELGVKCWVMNLNGREWLPRLLIEIDHEREKPFRTYASWWTFCTLEDPYAKKMRPMTTAECLGWYAHHVVGHAVRGNKMSWLVGCSCSFVSPENYEWCTVSEKGEYGPAQKFEVKDSGDE